MRSTYTASMANSFRSRSTAKAERCSAACAIVEFRQQQQRKYCELRALESQGPVAMLGMWKNRSAAPSLNGVSFEFLLFASSSAVKARRSGHQPARLG